MNRRNLIFLHIPKTAGQSIHAYFINSFGAAEVCPARTMDQLAYLSVPFLSRFRVYSGHFDWDSVASVAPNAFTMTVLRDPFERILSFYFYLREIGIRNDGKSGIAGADMAATLHPDQFFWDFPDDKTQEMTFNNFDNFYTFFFSTRRYNARKTFCDPLIKSLDAPVRFAALNLARENLASLDLVLHFDNVDDVPSLLAEHFPECQPVKLGHLNANPAFSREARFEELKKIGASDWIFDIITQYCKLDDELVKEFVSTSRLTASQPLSEAPQLLSDVIKLN